MVAVGYMDPGNWATILLEVHNLVILFIIRHSFIQYFCNYPSTFIFKLGIAAERDLAASLQRSFFANGKFYFMGFMRNRHYCL